jgi:type I restriction enzyme S subunit
MSVVGTIGQAIIAKSDLDGINVSRAISVIRLHETAIELRYFLRLIESPQVLSWILENSRGSAQKVLNLGVLDNLSASIPPFAEQHRIVAKIEATFKRIEAIEKAVETAESLLVKYRESLLNKAFRGELVPRDPKDEPASKLLERIRAERDKQPDAKNRKKADLPPITEEEIPFEIPQSWEWVRLGDIVSDVRYGTSKHCSPEKIHTPVLRIPNVVGGKVTIDDLKYAKFEAQEIVDLSLQEGDILMIRSNGSLKLVGKTAVVDQVASGFLFAGYLIRIRTGPRQVEPQYISSFMNAVSCRNSIERQAQSTSGINNFSAEKLINLVIPVPPIDEQRRLLLGIESKDPILAFLQKGTEDLKSALQQARGSLLDFAFSGRLVPQDPSEGTGHQLLEQILVTKAKADSTKAPKAPAKKSRSPK